MDLFLFSSDTALVARADAIGMTGVVVDLERRGKHRRQRSFDTEINVQGPEDVRLARALTGGRVICRSNTTHDSLSVELDAVIDAGADEVLFPMARGANEIARVLDVVAGRADVSAMIETVDAVDDIDDIARLPLCRFYLGLTDLAIDRGTPSIFTSLVDGVADRVRDAVGDQQFGVAGVTHPDAGSPLPSRHVINELSRLRVEFAFLRRSFVADAARFGETETVDAIRCAFHVADRRDPVTVAHDRDAARAAIDALPDWA